MAYFMYIQTVCFPITPGKITLKIANKNKTITLINEGEVNIPKSPGLTEFSFKFMLPWCNYPFVNMNYPQMLTDAIPTVRSVLSGKWKLSNVENFFKNFNLKNFIMGDDDKLGIFPSQDEWLTKLSKYKTEKKAFQFKIQRIDSGFSLDKLPITGNIDLKDWSMRTGHIQFAGWTTDMMVTLEDCKIIEDAKEYKDVWVEVKLKEFVPYGTKAFEVKDGKLVEKGSAETEAKKEADKENAAKSALGEENAKTATEQATQQATQTAQQTAQQTTQQVAQNITTEAAKEVFKQARQNMLEQMKQQALRGVGG